MLVKMNLDRFNLNLFVAFEALSKADTLTQAAGALCVTQSTLSVALRQMREYFDDELFVYKPKQKELTPLAQNSSAARSGDSEISQGDIDVEGSSRKV